MKPRPLPPHTPVSPRRAAAADHSSCPSLKQRPSHAATCQYLPHSQLSARQGHRRPSLSPSLLPTSPPPHLQLPADGPSALMTADRGSVKRHHRLSYRPSCRHTGRQSIWRHHHDRLTDRGGERRRHRPGLIQIGGARSAGSRLSPCLHLSRRSRGPAGPRRAAHTAQPPDEPP